MLVTFVSPSSSKSHTYGPYEMSSIPGEGDRIEIETDDERLAFNVGTARYSLGKPHWPVRVKVSIFGPLGSNPYVGM